MKQFKRCQSDIYLLEAWTVAKPLCLLHHAVTYQSMVQHLEVRTKHEVSRMLPYLLREIIRLC
ncbi:MAG: hypothetical protein AAGI69_16075 [Cyanobacteria bacterium P01_H01_bin.21]